MGWPRAGVRTDAATACWWAAGSIQFRGQNPPDHRRPTRCGLRPSRSTARATTPAARGSGQEIRLQRSDSRRRPARTRAHLQAVVLLRDTAPPNGIASHRSPMRYRARTFADSTRNASTRRVRGKPCRGGVSGEAVTAARRRPHRPQRGAAVQPTDDRDREASRRAGLLGPIPRGQSGAERG
jgi:hypothetical protein